MASIGERLKFLRLKNGPTQKSIAEAVGITEVSYQRYEYGSVCPSLTVLIALADFFDVSLDFLVGRSDDPAAERRIIRKALAYDIIQRIQMDPEKKSYTVDDLKEIIRLCLSADDEKR